LWQEVQKGKTLVVVTHKPSLLALMNRIIVIAGNQVVLDGLRDTVLNQLKQRAVAAPAASATRQVEAPDTPAAMA
jgi:ATP-binding cassette subfamily C protein LapB